MIPYSRRLIKMTEYTTVYKRYLLLYILIYLNYMVYSQRINKELYRSAILYFIKYCNNQYLGKTKLNKLLYYLDFISHRDSNESFTGDKYIHKDYGPVPADIDDMLIDLANEGVIETSVVDYKDGETFKFQLKKEKELDENIFSASQKKLLKNICDEFAGWSTDKIVTQTHLEAPWFYSKPYQVVDYSYSKDIDFFR